MPRKLFRRLCLLVLVASLSVAGLRAPRTAQASNGSVNDGQDAYIPNEVNIKLFQASDIQAVAQQYKLQLLDQFGSRPIYHLRVTDGVDAKQKAADLAADSARRVQFAEPNYTSGSPEGSGLTWSVANSWSAGLTWSVGGQAQFASQWVPTKLRLPEAHAVTRGAGEIVAVLDTGVDRRHPLLAGRLLRGHDFVDDDDDPSEVQPTCPTGSSSTDPRACGPYGHGTVVAGLIALAAPEAKIMPLRVLDPQGVGNNWVLMEAIRYALDPDGDPTTDDGADVINMSLASIHRSDILRNIVGHACDDKTIEAEDSELNPEPPPAHPVVVVVAAGNEGTETLMYPAAENATGEISVGASDQNDALASFSEQKWPDVMAPGVQITSSVPGKGTGTWSGTSMASPLVAGQAALVRALTPTLAPSDVKERIRESSARTHQAIDRRVDAAASVVPFATGTGSPVDATPDYVRQNYLDFLNRAPDASGFAFWQNEISSCGADANCTAVKRVNVSAAFFLSIEFQNTGYFVYRMHKAAFGNLTGAPVPVSYEDFMPDTQKIGEGLVVGQTGWEQKLEDNKNAFALDFVSRPEFAGAFPADMTPAAFVDRLFANAGVAPTQTERDALVAELTAANNPTQARADVLRKVAENQSLVRQEFDRAFVLMQYFGYLRRNPNDSPDSDFSGYGFWLAKLEQFGGDFAGAEMVKAFISSTEYRARFGHR